MAEGEETLTIADKLVTIAENEKKVYEAGKQTVHDTIWEAIQNGGERTDYSYAFAEGKWDKDSFKPKYDIKPTNAMNMFSGIVVSDENKQVDMTELDIKFDFSNCTRIDRAFSSSLFSVIDTVDLSKVTNANYMTAVFYDGYGEIRKKAINKIIVAETTPFQSNTFGYCTELVKIYFKGYIGTSINFKDCHKLNRASIVTMFVDNLSPNVTGQTITFSKKAVNNVFGSTDASDWVGLFPLAPNWTVSVV